jgi:hypothetical protein
MDSSWKYLIPAHGNEWEEVGQIISMGWPLEMYCLLCLYYFKVKVHGNIRENSHGNV